MIAFQKNRLTLKSDEPSTNLQDFAQKLESTLSVILPQPSTRLNEAMRYCVLGGGKRIRPYLSWAAGQIFAVPEDQSLKVGAAIEFIHAYSLAHDDLPCMDDAETRRGKPSCHKAFGEATAVLVGDALIPLAFQTITTIDTDPKIKLELIERLGQVSGTEGIVAGQMMDLGQESFAPDLENIIKIQELKTAGLFEFSVEAGGILGKAPLQEREALRAFGLEFGRAFQMIDDLLDYWGLEENIGKPCQQDADKLTHLNFLSPEQLYQNIMNSLHKASVSLDSFESKGDLLREIAEISLKLVNKVNPQTK